MLAGGPDAHHRGMTTETFQLPLEAAEAYEAMFVPAFFAQWAPLTCAAAGVAPATPCSTSPAARASSPAPPPTSSGRGASVVGVDRNESMLVVARRVRPELDWRQGDAGRLPVPDAAFDAVLCQMALMFFPDRAAGVPGDGAGRPPGGAVAVLVPAALDEQEAFRLFVDVAARHAGPSAVELLTTYFACGDAAAVAGLLEGAGLTVTASESPIGVYAAPSVDAFVATEVESTPLRERISDDVYARIKDDAHTALAPFTTADGRVEAPFASLVVSARR